MPGGVTWEGDVDNEIIFGTMWLDALDGDQGDDILYGFEGDDTMTGGYGVDRLFGDAGDDTMFLGDTTSPTERPTITAAGMYGETLTNTVTFSTGDNSGDFASGGTGNDFIVGTNESNNMFGGPGHDVLLAYNSLLVPN